MRQPRRAKTKTQNLEPLAGDTTGEDLLAVGGGGMVQIRVLRLFRPSEGGNQNRCLTRPASLIFNPTKIVESAYRSTKCWNITNNWPKMQTINNENSGACHLGRFRLREMRKTCGRKSRVGTCFQAIMARSQKSIQSSGIRLLESRKDPAPAQGNISEWLSSSIRLRVGTLRRRAQLLPALRIFPHKLNPNSPIPARAAGRLKLFPDPLPVIRSETWLVHPKVREQHLSPPVGTNFVPLALVLPGRIIRTWGFRCGSRMSVWTSHVSDWLMGRGTDAIQIKLVARRFHLFEVCQCPLSGRVYLQLWFSFNSAWAPLPENIKSPKRRLIRGVFLHGIVRKSCSDL